MDFTLDFRLLDTTTAVKALQTWTFHGQVSLLLHGKSSLGKWEGSMVSSSIVNDQWSWALYVVGSKWHLCQPQFSQDNHSLCNLAPCSLQTDDFISSFWVLPISSGSTLCSQISGVFLRYVRILFKCLYSPKPKLSNYSRKKASLNMPIKMNLSQRKINFK